MLGGPEETGKLLEHKFDYIFFTGEGDPRRVLGRGVMLESKVRREQPVASGGECPRWQSVQAGGLGLWVLEAWRSGILGWQGQGQIQWVRQDGPEGWCLDHLAEAS